MPESRHPAFVWKGSLLNRMRFGNVGIEAGCKNFERLPGTHEMFAILAEEYAKARGFDVQTCLELIEQAHSLSD